MKVTILLKDERQPSIELDNVNCFHAHYDSSKSERYYSNALLNVLDDKRCTGLSFIVMTQEFPEVEEILYVLRDSVAAIKVTKSR